MLVNNEQFVVYFDWFDCGLFDFVWFYFVAILYFCLDNLFVFDFYFNDCEQFDFNVDV